MITYDITLELSKQSEMPCVYAKQGDSESRYIRVALTDNGSAYVPSGVEANFRARKADGTMVYNPAEILQDGSVVLELTQQTLAVPGLVYADLCLCGEEGQILSSAPFLIRVDGMPQGELTQSSNEWITLLNRLYALELDYATDEQVAAAIAVYLTENPPERGENGATFTPEISMDGVLSWTNDRNLENPKNVAIVQKVIDALGAAPVFGYVDEENDILLTSLLPVGTYVLKYEDSDGNVTQIGSVTVRDEPSE